MIQKEMVASIRHFLFRQWGHKEQQSAVIQTLWKFIAVLVLLNLVMFLGWKTAPDKLRVYIPPNIERGGWLKPGVIPESTVYAFAYEIFAAVNTWTNGGEHDYRSNISAYKNYFSDKFFQKLMTDSIERSASGALTRNRVMSGVTGMGYEPVSVKSLGNNVWSVDMKLHILETVDASVVKDVIMDYTFIVSAVNESIVINPWGLQITDFGKEAERVKTNV